MPIIENEWEVDKENFAPATGSRSPEAHNLLSEDIYNDILVARWLQVQKTGNVGRTRGRKDSGKES